MGIFSLLLVAHQRFLKMLHFIYIYMASAITVHAIYSVLNNCSLNKCICSWGAMQLLCFRVAWSGHCLPWIKPRKHYKPKFRIIYIKTYYHGLQTLYEWKIMFLLCHLHKIRYLLSSITVIYIMNFTTCSIIFNEKIWWHWYHFKNEPYKSTVLFLMKRLNIALKEIPE